MRMPGPVTQVNPASQPAAAPLLVAAARPAEARGNRISLAQLPN